MGVSGGRDTAELEELALAQDEQCDLNAKMGHHGSCALSALQRRSQQQHQPKQQQEQAQQLQQQLKQQQQQEKQQKQLQQEQEQQEKHEQQQQQPAQGWDQDSGLQDRLTSGQHLAADFVSTDDWGGCPAHPGTKNCLLYRECQGPAFCVLHGYMIVPGFYAAGMESINAGNAASFDYLMAAAKDKCSSPSCVLITNPAHHRTQDQLHIHYRYMNFWGGRSLKRRLERELCGTWGWQHFSKCGDSKARLYDAFPGVFSEVAEAYPGPNLAHVGITVWFTQACGGYKTMLLATTHCSIEHGITR